MEEILLTISILIQIIQVIKLHQFFKSKNETVNESLLQELIKNIKARIDRLDAYVERNEKK